jgi:hypothetical protein
MLGLHCARIIHDQDGLDVAGAAGNNNGQMNDFSATTANYFA